MKNFIKFAFLILISISSINSFADVTCEGKITKLQKWSDQTHFSIMLSGADRLIRVGSDMDASMAMMAFAAGKKVGFVWTIDSITSCAGGWDHNRLFVGFWEVYEDQLN